MDIFYYVWRMLFSRCARIDFVDGRCFIHLDNGFVSGDNFVSSEVGEFGWSTVGTGVIFMGVRYILTGANSFRI